MFKTLFAKQDPFSALMLRANPLASFIATVLTVILDIIISAALIEGIAYSWSQSLLPPGKVFAIWAALAILNKLFGKD